MLWKNLLKPLLLASSLFLFVATAVCQSTGPGVWKIKLDLKENPPELSKLLGARDFSAFAILPESGPYPSAISVTINGMKLRVTRDEHAPRPTYFISHGKNITDLQIDYEGSVELYAINSGKPPVLPSSIMKNQSDCLIMPPSVDQEDWRSGLPTPNFSRLRHDVTHIVVHHTAGSNTNTNYTQVVRDIYLLHTQVNGWSDIGYNFLVAQDGTIYDGRDPGSNLTEFEVVGAHFCGKNTGTLGISMLGNYETAVPSAAAVERLNELLAFSFDALDIDPEGISNHRGTSLNHLSGHRDGCSTLCPGANLYAQLPALRNSIQSDIEDCADPEPPGVAPILSFEAPSKALTRSSIQFTNTSTGYDSYEWAFDGGTPEVSDAATVDVTYRVAGVYDVTLIGTSSSTSDTLLASNYVQVSSDRADPWIYPNPVVPGEELWIELEEPIISIQIISITGKDVGYYVGVDGVLTVPILQKGNYLLRIRTQQRTFTKKLIIF